MASIKERNGSYQITVSCGRDIYGKKLIETTTFTPDSGLTPKKRQKAVEEFARQFEADVKNGIAMDGTVEDLYLHGDTAPYGSLSCIYRTE